MRQFKPGDFVRTHPVDSDPRLDTAIEMLTVARAMVANLYRKLNALRDCSCDSEAEGQAPTVCEFHAGEAEQ